MRAGIVRCLLNTDNYRASLLAIFTLLAPPSLDPELSLHFDAVGFINRSLQSLSAAQDFARLLPP